MADGVSQSSALLLHSLMLGEKLGEDEVEAVMQNQFVMRGFLAARNADIKGLQDALMSATAMQQPAVRALWSELHLRLNAAKKSGPLPGVAKEVKVQAGANGGVTFEKADTTFDSGLHDLVRALGTAIPARFINSTSPSYDGGRRAIVGPALQLLIKRLIMLGRAQFTSGVTDCSDRPDLIKAGYLNMEITDYVTLTSRMLAIWSTVFTPWIYPAGAEPSAAVLAGPAAEFPIFVLWSRMIMEANTRGFDMFNGDRGAFLKATIGTFVDKFKASVSDLLMADLNRVLSAAETTPTISHLVEFLEPLTLRTKHWALAIRLASPASPAAGAASKGKGRLQQQLGSSAKRRALQITFGDQDDDDDDDPLPESSSDEGSDSDDQVARERRRKGTAKQQSQQRGLAIVKQHGKRQAKDGMVIGTHCVRITAATVASFLGLSKQHIEGLGTWKQGLSAAIAANATASGSAAGYQRPIREVLVEMQRFTAATDFETAEWHVVNFKGHDLPPDFNVQSAEQTQARMDTRQEFISWLHSSEAADPILTEDDAPAPTGLFQATTVGAMQDLCQAFDIQVETAPTTPDVLKVTSDTNGRVTATDPVNTSVSEL